MMEKRINRQKKEHKTRCNESSYQKELKKKEYKEILVGSHNKNNNQYKAEEKLNSVLKK